MSTAELRAACAERLEQAQARPAQIKVFLGLDGFVDDIMHVVDKRHTAEKFDRIDTMAEFAQRIAMAAGKGTNIEMVKERTKLGGNGPIMANAMASFGFKVSYLGALGYPDLHPVFSEFAQKSDVSSIAEAGHTEALEFEDGKLMLGTMSQLREITWENIQQRYGRDKFIQHTCNSDLIGFMNWTMIPYMSDVWEAMLREICPGMTTPRRKIFFDLADPEKRPKDHIVRALEIITRFNKYFDVILGLNQKESDEVRKALGLAAVESSEEGLSILAEEIIKRVPIQTLIIHPITYALAWCNGQVDVAQGPCVPVPLITTGAGDHFNAGFCLGKLLGLENRMCVLTGVASSGFYVATAKSPTVPELVKMLRNWQEKPAS